MISDGHPQEQFMKAAIAEARNAYRKGDYAIGAVIVKNNKIIVSVANATKVEEDPTCHAELVAISRAAKLLNQRHLLGCVLYTTHEPCPMCVSAAVWAKLDGIVWGARIEDMANYAEQNNNQHYAWRTIKIKASEIIDKAPNKPFVIEEFMREECKNLFHSTELLIN